MTAHPRRGLIGNSEANTSKGGMLTMNSNLGYFNGIGQEFSNLPIRGNYEDTSFWFSSLESFHVSHNGKYLFTLASGTTSDWINRWPLSTPYDITTKSSPSADQSFYTSAYGEFTPRVMRWSDDGYYLYISGSDDDNITQWHAVAPWDMGPSGNNTLKLGGREVAKFSNVDTCEDIAFSSDGTKMFLLDSF